MLFIDTDLKNPAILSTALGVLMSRLSSFRTLSLSQAGHRGKYSDARGGKF